MIRPVLFVAGGGTGGHVFPGLAVAEALQSLANVRVVFCGTARGLEASAVPAAGYRLEVLDVEPIKGGGVVRAVRGSLVAAGATFAARKLVADLRPRAVLSVGGYASGPVTLAAALLGVPVAVLEPNSVPGLANRALAPWAKRAYVAWESAATPFRVSALRRTGVPLRRGFFPSEYTPKDRIRVLVMGGSQGASALNERLPKAIATLGPLTREFDVVHQSGVASEAEVRAAYAREGVTAATVVPFIDDVASALSAADVIVSRAGAVTIGEVTAVGRAAILVPFPRAADDHQKKNAEALARAGAALCIEQESASPARLASELARLASQPSVRVAMANASRSLGRPNAAHDVASDLLALASLAPSDRQRVRESDRILRLLEEHGGSGSDGVSESSNGADKARME